MDITLVQQPYETHDYFVAELWDDGDEVTSGTGFSAEEALQQLGEEIDNLRKTGRLATTEEA